MATAPPRLGITIHMGAASFGIKDAGGSSADLRELCKEADSVAYKGGDMALMDVATGISNAMGLRKAKRTNRKRSKKGAPRDAR